VTEDSYGSDPSSGFPMEDHTERVLLHPHRDAEFAEMGELHYEERSTGMRVVSVGMTFQRGNAEEAVRQAAKMFHDLIRRCEAEERLRLDERDAARWGGGEGGGSAPGTDEFENTEDPDDEDEPGLEFGKFRRPQL